MADIAARLPAIRSSGDKLKTAQAAATGEAIGRLLRLGPAISGAGPVPKPVLDAARCLAQAQTEDMAGHEDGSSAGAVSRWIEAFINPASPTALEGAVRLWTTALARQRDLDRRRHHRSDGVGPVKLALSATYGRLLADLQEGTPGKSTCFCRGNSSILLFGWL